MARAQAVFYILFFRLIQEDAWEKAGEGRLAWGLDCFPPGNALFLVKIDLWYKRKVLLAFCWHGYAEKADAQA
jgi:hypothetical protein